MRFSRHISHPELHRFRVITSATPWEVENKAESQLQIWADEWARKVEAERKKAKKEELAKEKEQKILLASELTADAEKAIAELEGILLVALHKRYSIDWETLKDRKPLHRPRPTQPARPVLPEKPDKSSVPLKPHRDEARFQPKFGLLDSLFERLKQRKINKANESYESALKKWRDVVRQFNDSVARYNQEIKLIDQRYAETMAAFKQEMQRWESKQAEFAAEQRMQHAQIEAKKKALQELDSSAVTEYFEMVLSNSSYPDFCPQSFEFDYVPQTKTLVVDYYLPRVEDIPSTKSAKYIQTRNEIVSTMLSESARNKLYDDLIYRITLRTLHELLDADQANVLDSIVFNGIVETIDKSTGQTITPCILSVQVSRKVFEAIRLDQVEPKACFKKLKGVSAPTLHNLAPVPPIAQINREDRRFIASYDVAAGLNDSMNLASMDWEDFEHFIRELFAKEFAFGGGEVKVTRASRDGGVDAVAFDPDPIRGGKIVIQAKRYTNVVGVSAVRDLYGTVVNEGAIKGILVTTAHYGADAYEFAKEKPLTLLDGGHLLHLLAKHGHRARIDLKEAKKEAASRKAESK
jgi:restriction system protein